MKKVIIIASCVIGMVASAFTALCLYTKFNKEYQALSMKDLDS